MGRKRSAWGITAGILASVCATALGVVIFDMIVDSWLTPFSFSTASILVEFVLAVIAAVLFFARLPLWGLTSSTLAFLFGEGLGRTITNGNGIFWPFTALSDLGELADVVSPFFALATALLDLAFVLIIATIIVGIIAAIVPAANSPVATLAFAGQSPLPQQGIPAGWYRDPNGMPCQRYWDGSTWTESTAPLG